MLIILQQNTANLSTIFFIIKIISFNKMQSYYNFKLQRYGCEAIYIHNKSLKRTQTLLK